MQQHRSSLARWLVLGIVSLQAAEAFLLQPSPMLPGLRNNNRAACCSRPRPPQLRNVGRPLPHTVMGNLRMDVEEEFGFPDYETFDRTSLKRVPDLPSRYPMPERIVAIGDVHGDLEALRKCLRMANLIDEQDSWVGGGAHLVQVGDILDRGEAERGCIDLLLKARREAEAAGGHVHLLLGNHEIMNVDLDFRYVTSRHAWEGWAPRPEAETAMGEADKEAGEELAGILREMGWPRLTMDRVEAFRPGGHVTLEALAHTSVALVIGDTVFVHGGLLAKHVEYGLERLNWETRAWLVEGSTRPEFQHKPDIMDSIDAPVWNRLYSTPHPKEEALEELERVLSGLGARRMVMGHTPQLRGINAVFSKRGYEAWRCDTGMSSAMMGGPVEVLEILADGTVHVLTPSGVVPAAERSPEWVGEFVDVCDVGSGMCTPMPEELAKLQIGGKESKEEEEEEGEKKAVQEATGSAQEKEALLGVEGGKREEERRAEEEAERWKAGRKEAVEKLRRADRRYSEWSAETRIGALLLVLLEDAREREDRGLCKLTVKEMLSAVVGVEVMRGQAGEVFAELERLAPPTAQPELNDSIIAKLNGTLLAKAKATADLAHRNLQAEEVKGEVVSVKRAKKSGGSGVQVKNGVAKREPPAPEPEQPPREAEEGVREEERRATVEVLARQDAALAAGGLGGKERVKRTLARILLDAADRKDAAMTRRHVREMLEGSVGAELAGEHLVQAWGELDRLFASALPAMGAEQYLRGLTPHQREQATQHQRARLEYHLALAPKR